MVNAYDLFSYLYLKVVAEKNFGTDAPMPETSP